MLFDHLSTRFENEHGRKPSDQELQSIIDTMVENNTYDSVRDRLAQIFESSMGMEESVD
jgi:hypothetical protein